MKSFDNKKVDASLLSKDITNAPDGNPFLNKKVVFTGDLISWERQVAASLLQKLGADVNTSISSRTQIVIIGQDAGPAKLAKIIDLLSSGCEIKLMNEKIFDQAVLPYK